MKIGIKIAAAMALIVFAVLAALGAFDVAAEAELLEADMTRDQIVVATLLASAAESELHETRQDTAVVDAVRTAEQHERHLKLTWGRLDDRSGDRLPDAPATVWRELERGATASFRTSKPEEEQWTLARVKGPEGTDSYFVGVGESLAEERAHLTSITLRTAAAIAALAVLCAAITLVVATRFIGRPVRMLVEHARQIASGNFGRRLVVRQHDEIGDLVTEMNAMSAELESSNDKLRRETKKRLDALEQLRHADRLTTVGKLASGLAHELGTPLNVVHGYGKLVQAREGVDEEVRHNAEIIVAQAEKMTRLVRQLLDFARRKGPKKERTDLTTLARRVASVLEPAARKKSVLLEVGAAEEMFVDADAGMIEQVLTNLVFNALQASDRGARPIQIGVARVDDLPAPHPSSGGPFVLVTVRDHGCGIAEDDLPRIFEPFFTTKDVGEGTGLGLSVSHGIIQDHGGLILAESVPGESTVFSVYLPESQA